MSDASQPERHPIDAVRVQRLFSQPRAVAADDFLQREVARRMMERLATIRIDASRMVDLGCGAGSDFATLRERCPDAALVGVDFALPRVARIPAERRPSGLSRLLRREVGPGTERVCADFGALPFASRCFDLLWSNLALHWSAAPHAVLPEWSRVTRVGGLLTFSAFGPDTLREVADAFRQVDSAPRVMPFTDMHDYGDMLVASGFTTPVVDMERLTLTYSDRESLWRDVRALGGDALLGRARSLRGRAFGERLAAALEQGRDADGRFRLTFEMIFAHAWRGEPRTTSRGETIVRLARPR